MTQEPQVEQPSRIIARMSKEWRNRQFMIIGILLAFSAWFFFDAFVGFPARNEAFDAYKKLEADKQEKLAALKERKNEQRAAAKAAKEAEEAEADEEELEDE